MLVPRKTMETELKTQEKELADDISSLNKKVRPNSSLISIRNSIIISVKIPRKTAERCAVSAT